MLRIIVLTSLRDVALCDKNGEKVETETGLQYMMGALEYLVRQTLPGGSLEGLFQVVGVVTDDRPKDLAGYPATPSSGRPWVHPLDLYGPCGSRISDLTVNIASDFRSLPLGDEEGRRREKEYFERRVYELMNCRKATLLLSDHYMAQIDFLHAWVPGRVLNIHPGVTLSGHPYSFLGRTPTADAIARAKREEGVRTGATLHYMDGIIDHGPPIMWSDVTPVHASDTPEALRHRNYEMAKLPVLIAGLTDYHRSHSGVSQQALGAGG